jgi:hypothetical protein
MWDEFAMVGGKYCKVEANPILHLAESREEFAMVGSQYCKVEAKTILNKAERNLQWLEVNIARLKPFPSFTMRRGICNGWRPILQG